MFGGCCQFYISSLKTIVFQNTLCKAIEELLKEVNKRSQSNHYKRLNIGYTINYKLTIRHYKSYLSLFSMQ